MGAAAAKLAEMEVSDAQEASLPIRAVLEPARTAPARLKDQWEALARAASEPNAFAEHWFAAASLEHMEPGRDVRLLEVWEGTILIGLLPLCISDAYGRITVGHAENWLHVHSFLGTPLVRRSREEAFWRAAIETLDREPWAKSFLHLVKLVEDGPVLRGLQSAAQSLGRRCDIVYRFERALLESRLSPDAYYESTVRKKKRKELKRLSNRLAEAGEVVTRSLTSAEELRDWCDQFLSLEAAGWKGRGGSALTCNSRVEAFFRQAVEGAFQAGKLDFLRLDLDGRPIAMLVNFLSPPGSFSFKIAFDEEHARFSPGVLIQIENYRILSRGNIGWMDSCAVEDHPMINSLWAERRRLVRVTVPLKGLRRRMIFSLCRLVENASAAIRRVTKPADERKTDDE
jgi:CelD/BcsL family acetyltransferase involved in cellulose biosynthesis